MFIKNFDEDVIDLIITIFKKLEVDYYDPENPPLQMNSSCKRFVKIFGSDTRLRILMRQFVNINQKYLPPFRWKIKISSKLENYKEKTYVDKVEFFIKLAQQSSNLSGFLSKMSLWAYDEDNLLNCWSIHHIHLSTELEEAGKFFKRSDDLLMVHQSKDTLYLIDIISHKDEALEPSSGKKVNLAFSRFRVVETLIREFPEVGNQWKINGILPGEVASDFDHRSLRKNGVQTMVQVDGHCYMPGFGISTAATGVRATMQSDSYRQMIYTWGKHIEDNYHSILNDLSLSFDVSRPAIFKLVLRNGEFVVYEKKSNSFLLSMSEKKYFRRLPIGAI